MNKDFEAELDYATGGIKGHISPHLLQKGHIQLEIMAAIINTATNELIEEVIEKVKRGEIHP